MIIRATQSTRVRQRNPSSPWNGAIVGDSLVDSIEISHEKLNLLFFALLLTSLGVFFFANLLVIFNLEILKYSLSVTAVCVEILSVFYLLSRSQRSPIIGLAVTYVLVWMVAYLHHFGVSILFHALSVFSMGYTVRYLRILRTDFQKVAAMAIVATVSILGIGTAYTSFCIVPNLHLGRVHQDTLFLSSIGAMIKNYGVQSTGLHGLVILNYHTFSIGLHAAISVLSGQGVIECYGVAPWVLFVPIAIFSLVCFVVMLDQNDRVSLPMLWMVTCLLLTIVPKFFSGWSLDGLFASESQVIAVGILMLGSALLFKRNLGVNELVLAVLIAYLLGQTKGPVGIMWAILWLSRSIFIVGSNRSLGILGSVLVCIAVYMATAGTAKASGESVRFSLFHHIIKYVYGGDRLSTIFDDFRTTGGSSPWGIILMIGIIACFTLIHYLFSWILIQGILRQRGIFGLFRSPIAIYCMGLVSASFGVIALFQVGAGNEGNFSICAFFFALPVVVAYFLPPGESRLVGSNAITMFGFAITLVIVGISYSAYREKSYFSASWHYFKGKRNALVDELKAIKTESPILEILEVTEEMRTKNPLRRCTARPFVFPAVSERPWIGVLRNPETDCQYYGYGYPDYGVKSSREDVTIPVPGLEGMTIQPSVP